MLHELVECLDVVVQQQQIFRVGGFVLVGVVVVSQQPSIFVQCLFRFSFLVLSQLLNRKIRRWFVENPSRCGGTTNTSTVDILSRTFGMDVSVLHWYYLVVCVLKWFGRSVVVVAAVVVVEHKLWLT